jgi:hypothetical protein
MDAVRKCPKCGLDLTDPAASHCPVCGTVLGVRPRGTLWMIALMQFAVMAIFMTVFHFPKIFLVFLGGMILIGTLFSSVLKPIPVRKLPPRPLSHPVLFRFVGAGVALCIVAILASLLFGFVIFMNSWTRWHRYEGQSFHRSDFRVEQVYRQKSGKSVDVYARGSVEGQREWMNLAPYLHTIPRSQQELEERVPAGVEIPIYYFPAMKGRARVQVYTVTPPAEASHREAITALNYSLAITAVAVGLLFLFLRVQKTCYAETEVIQGTSISAH